jgi:sugar/nucleoside kinase (ribokinase family)
VAILAVGSVALDSLETPFGRADDALGGSVVHFSAAASLFAPVQVVGVVGEDYPLERLDFLRDRGVDLSGLESTRGESFRWSGRYTHDLSSPETLETRLGVFANFHPRIPESFRSPDLLFLGNIDPTLQIEVLEQVTRPRLVACDTMNFWIAGKRSELLRLLERVDLLIVNDGEIRQLAEDANLVRAARWVQSRGPERVMVKKGEHGAVLFDGEEIFFVPGYPLEDLNDPTGAGDSFAGGVLGFLHNVEEHSAAALRGAAVVGCAVGSFTVEDFGVRRLVRLRPGEVAARVQEIARMTQFDLSLAGTGLEVGG